MRGVRRLPAALVALILGHAGGFFGPALGTEFAFVYRTAAAGPAVCLGFGLLRAALQAEFSVCRCAALGALPAIGGRLGLGLFAASVGAETAGNAAFQTHLLENR